MSSIIRHFKDQPYYSATTGILGMAGLCGLLKGLHLVHSGTHPNSAPPSLTRIIVIFGLFQVSMHILEGVHNTFKEQSKRCIINPNKRSAWKEIADALYQVTMHETCFPNLMRSDVRNNLDRQRYFSLTTGVFCAVGLYGTIKGVQLVFLSGIATSLRGLIISSCITFASVHLHVRTRHILEEQGRGGTFQLLHKASSPRQEIANALRLIFASSTLN